MSKTLTLKSKYQSRRQYPSLEEQLDALWHGMDQNPSQRIEPFYSMLRSVKNADPKPERLR